MIEILGAAGAAALLFAVFGILSRGRNDAGRCAGCHCSDVCERDGHEIPEVEQIHVET